MNTAMERPRGIRWLPWVILLAFLVATLAIGSVTLFRAHAASPLDGRYNLRGIATSGPNTGLYLTAAVSISVDSSGHVAGTAYGLKIALQRASVVTGSATQTGSSISLTIGHLLRGYPTTLVLTGGAVSTAGHHGGFDGFEGTFTLGATSGTWEARVTSFPQLSGSWNLFGIVEHGPDTGKQIHGVLTLIEQANGRLTGTYWHNGYVPVTGGRSTVGGTSYFYLDIPVLSQVIRLRDTFLSSTGSRISGQFESLNPNQKGVTDRGYWLGH